MTNEELQQHLTEIESRIEQLQAFKTQVVESAQEQLNVTNFLIRSLGILTVTAVEGFVLGLTLILAFIDPDFLRETEVKSEELPFLLDVLGRLMLLGIASSTVYLTCLVAARPQQLALTQLSNLCRVTPNSLREIELRDLSSDTENTYYKLRNLIFETAETDEKVSWLVLRNLKYQLFRASDILAVVEEIEKYYVELQKGESENSQEAIQRIDKVSLEKHWNLVNLHESVQTMIGTSSLFGKAEEGGSASDVKDSDVTLRKKMVG